jgi:hypothetical protein
MEAKHQPDHDDVSSARPPAPDEHYLTSEQIDGLVVGAQRFMETSVQPPQVSKNSPGPRYQRALDTLRKHGITV